MAFSELEAARCQRAIDRFMERRRPPPRIRAKVDLRSRLTGQSVEIFELRPDWRDPTKTIESAVAKATFVRTQNLWRIYWRRSDLRWHRYGPEPEVETIEAFLDVVDRDAFGCFFG